MKLKSISLIIFLAQFIAIANSASNDDPQIGDNTELQLKSETTDDTEDDYNDYVDESEVSKQTRQRSHNILNRVGVTYSWDRWEKWSKCATTCVQIKRRKCIERTQNATDATPTERSFYPDAEHNLGCVGIVKRYRLCKDERCKASNQRLRDEQCESWNSVPYREKFYNWVGYEKEHDECQLYCRPTGSDLFVNRNQSVTDGTPCNRPAVFYTHYYRRRAVCVEGICRAVHSSGSIRPSTSKDSQLKCGSVLCKHVSELFNKTELPKGYNYITTIPLGAMNLTIRGQAQSKNTLALKTLEGVFVINGNHRAADSGVFELNDDSFDYNRERRVITSKGPLGKPVVLMLLVVDVSTNVGYNYTIPIPSAPVSEEEELQLFWDELGNSINESEDGGAVLRLKERKRRKFSWKLLGFGECNRSCGPGTQTPIFRCVRESPTRYYSPSRCVQIEKPTFSDDIYHCNRGLCPAFWRPSNFTDCHCPEGSSTGLRSRLFQCMQEQIKGNVVEVSDKLCNVRSEAASACTCHSSAPKPQAEFLASSRAPLRRDQRNSRVSLSSAGVWLMSAWRGECSKSACVPGAYQHRSIYCERTPTRGDVCDLSATPEQKRSCPSACGSGIWLTSEWSNCTGDCFNLQRWRTVLCLSEGLIVDEARCDKSRKPNSFRRCMRSEVDYCGPQWHYSDWSQCSRPCGEGVKLRHGKCLDYDWKQGALVESASCSSFEREVLYSTCNSTQCQETVDPLDSIESDDETTPASSADCTDEFRNCGRINRKSLCRLQYYKTYCCRSCQGYR